MLNLSKPDAKNIIVPTGTVKKYRKGNSGAFVTSAHVTKWTNLSLGVNSIVTCHTSYIHPRSPRPFNTVSIFTTLNPQCCQTKKLGSELPNKDVETNS